MAGELKELRVSNDASGDSTELRRRIEEEGYLFFRELLDPRKMLALRHDLTGVLREAGWLAPDADPMLGIADPGRRCTEGDLEYSKVYHRLYRLESFHRLPHDPQLLGMVERIMGRAAIPLPSHKARIWFPLFTEHTTPTHQDFVHYQGSLQALTCWAPVGDCPIDLGPLAVLPGSHKVKKVLHHHFSLGAGGLIIRVEEEAKAHPELDGAWHTASFSAGDILFFPALTVHKALPNTTSDRLRISLDNRYEGEGDRIASHMLEPHLNDVSPLSWEEVYEGWASDELKYYWKRRQHRPVARYMGYIEKGFTEALQLARNGDARAILALRRTVRINPASAEAAASRAVLQEIGQPADQRTGG
jgi:ectoine hydroxylase-related dioxygenase (phytanoyl-CoA dioxygenase family)